MMNKDFETGFLDKLDINIEFTGTNIFAFTSLTQKIITFAGREYKRLYKICH